MTPTTPDYDEIVRTVQLYLDGFQGDITKFEEAFHEDAWIFFTDAEGGLHKYVLTDCFAEWASWRKYIKGRFLSVTQAGDVASVLLGFGETWVDFHTLLRIDGVWKITNKTATHSSRAAWAAPAAG